MSARIGYLLQRIAGKPVSLLSLIATRPTTALYPTNLRTVTFAFRTKVTSAIKKPATTKKASTAKASTAKKATTRKTATGTKSRAANATSKTTTRKSATAKRTLKKKVTKRVAKKKTKKAAKVAAPKRKKKVLTDEEKFHEKVKKAKKDALRPPRSTFLNAYNMYCRESFSRRPSGVKGFIPITGESARTWQSMSASEKTKYVQLAQEANDRITADYNKFLEEHSVEKIQKANNARRWLKHKGIPRFDTTFIKDPRKPSRPIPAFLQFVRANYNTLEGTSIGEKGRAAGRAWNSLSENDKKPYVDMFLAEKEKVKSPADLTA